MPDLPDPKAHAHPHKGPNAGSRTASVSRWRGFRPPYAELCVTSNFTFLTGASHPDELVYQAANLGYQAVAIADHNGDEQLDLAVAPQRKQESRFSSVAAWY